MNLLGLLLFPFTLLYDLSTRIRNHLFKIGYSRVVAFQVPVISVGNLTVGGTGKTPVIEYLIRLLREKYPVAMLSRGYRRSTSGLRIADSSDTPSTIGDEPYQVWQKFGEDVNVTVCSDRAYAIPWIIDKSGEEVVVLLDDAYQHRSVERQMNILLTRHNRLFTKDFILPSGRLRETRSEARRANTIIVTHCPAQLEPGEEQQIEKEIKRYCDPGTPVYFSSIKYGNPLPEGISGYDRFVLVSGIADNTHFRNHLTNNYNVVDELVFRDHQKYGPSETRRIISTCKNHGENVAIITTEKDVVKLDKVPDLASIPIFHMPIEVFFLKNGRAFDEEVFKAINSVKNLAE